MSADEQQTTGIRLIPPLVYLVPLLSGVALEYLVPLVEIPPFARLGCGTILAGTSFALVVPTILKFRKADTPFNVRKPATTLVTDGPNSFTRNPGYVALTLLYLGLGFFFGSIWVLILVVPTLVLMDYGVIRREEQYLETKFGEEYARYKGSVRRWF